MNVIQPVKTKNLVRADSIPIGREFVDSDRFYYVVLDMLNHYFDCRMRDTVQNAHNDIWVFNINSSCLSVYEKDAMVEPVELEVNVKGKE